MKLVRILASLGGVLAATAGSAQTYFFPSVKLADVLGHREFYYALTAAGNERNVSRGGYGWNQEIGMGLFDRAELTLGNDFLGGSYFGLKALLYEDKKPERFALAAGICDVSFRGGEDPGYYVVGRTNPTERLRLHFGCTHDDRYRLTLGADYDLGHGCSAAVESISGPGHAIWGGFNVPLGTPQLMLSVGVGVPDRHQEGLQHSVGVSYGFRL